MYFVLFTNVNVISVFCFVYINVGYQCILFCLRLWDISVFCFVYVNVNISMYFVLLHKRLQKDIRSIFYFNVYVGYRCILFCFHSCGISVYFVNVYVGYTDVPQTFCLQNTLISHIDVFCFVYIHVGYQCILFCLHSFGITMYFDIPRLCRISMYFVLFTFVVYQCILFCLRL